MTHNVGGAPLRSDAPSHIYSFDVGAGSWQGLFASRVTSWRHLRDARGAGVQNRALAAAMAVTQRLTGPSRLESTIVADPSAGAFGVADNAVRLSQFGVTLYRRIS
ncbi:hypothetical protein [Streptomyces sp. NPDC090445]|uniref:hypothetical protein n=1 Tax=Streptomyces sp. NPDC090445 TaxID=3365963 RepID=UPI00380392CF